MSGNKSGVNHFKDGALGIKIGLRNSWLLIMTVKSHTESTLMKKMKNRHGEIFLLIKTF